MMWPALLPVLLNLSQIPAAQFPPLLRSLDTLNATAQILELPEQSERWPDLEGLAAPPESEGGTRFRAECSASLLSAQLAVTAQHCLRSKKEHFELNHLLRRHLFAWDGTVLRRIGYEDYRPTGRIVTTHGDLVAIEIARVADAGAPLIPIHSVAAGYDFQAEAGFLALGYPSFAYGVPHASPDCHVHDFEGAWYLVSPNDYGSKDCLIRGGMSGGPQLLTDGGAQIGINSISGGAGRETWTSSPQMPALSPSQY